MDEHKNYMRKYFKRQHQAGTCRMGNDPKMSVVDKYCFHRLLGLRAHGQGPSSLIKVISIILMFTGACSAAPAGHPRLLINAARIAALRREIQVERKEQWEIVRQAADSLTRRKPPAVRAKDAPDQLWQRDVGNAMPQLAMAWLLTGDRKYLAAAEAWAAASCNYPTWGYDRYLNNDLPAGHQLFGLAIVYDWLYADLDPQTRDLIHRTLLVHGRDLYHAADPKTGTYWKDEYLQNHLWVSLTGLAAAAFAIPEEKETSQWLDLVRDHFQVTEKSLGPDGASQEGVAYWSYGVEYMLKFWGLSSELLGEDLHNEWWSKTAMYRLYLSLPRRAWAKGNTIVDIADSTGEDYYGPDYLLFNLAHRFHDGYAQWLALELERAGLAINVAPFLDLLWFDPQVAPKPPTDLPTLRHFEDMGIVSARSDWSGSESLVVFKSGPPAGHEELTLGFKKDPGFGHVHPDANHFVIFGNGKWLLRDDGYAWKETGQHNTLLIDGVGQMGEHAQWFRRKVPLPLEGEPAILKAESHPTFDVIEGDAKGAYAVETGLQKFVRHVIFWKPSIVLVLDDIEADRPRELQLRFHPAEGASVRMEDLTPAGVSVSEGIIDGLSRDQKPLPQFTVRMQTNASKWRNVVAISWPSGAIAAPAVTMSREGENGLLFHAGGHELRFNWDGAESRR